METTPTMADLSNEWMRLADLNKVDHFKQFMRLQNIAAYYLISQRKANVDTTAPTAKSVLSREVERFEELDATSYSRLLEESPSFAIAIAQGEPLSTASL